MTGINNIGLEKPVEQMKWCEEKIESIAKKTEFSHEQIQFGIGSIIEKLRHLSFCLYDDPLKPIQSGKIIDMVFRGLLLKKDILSLYLNVEFHFYDVNVFVSNYLLLLNNNKELINIPCFQIFGGSLDEKLLESLMQALSGKVIEDFYIFGSQGEKDDNAILNICFQYLKEIKIENLFLGRIDYIESDGENISNLVENLPVDLDKLSLFSTDITYDGLIYFFENLKGTKVRYLDLTGNDFFDSEAEILPTNNIIKKLREVSHSLVLKEVSLINCNINDEDQSKFHGIKNKFKENIKFIFE